MTSAERFAVAIIARFSPPLISGIIMASARIPSSGIWKAIARNVSPERNRSGASAPKPITANTMNAPSNVTVGISCEQIAEGAPFRGRRRSSGDFRRHFQWSFSAGAWPPRPSRSRSPK